MATAPVPFGNLGTTQVLTASDKLSFDASSTTLSVTTSGSPVSDASAAMLISSTSQGFGLPRMSTVNMNLIPSPRTGLMIFNTTVNAVYIYNGSVWEDVGNGPVAAPSVTYTPTVPGNWPTDPTNAQEALDDLSADIAASPQQSVYVAMNGNDITGTGSITFPYLTITHALSTISTASPTNRFVVNIFPGTYTQNISLKANIFLNGLVDQACKITGNINLNDPSWAVSGDNRSGLSNLSTATGTAIFNFDTQSAANGKIYFQNVLFNQVVDFIGFDDTNQVVVQSSQLLSGLSQQGLTLIFDNTRLTNGGTINIYSVPTYNTYFNILGGSVDAPINLNFIFGHGNVYSTFDTFATGQITLNSTVASLPASNTLTATSSSLSLDPILNGPTGSNVVILQTPSSAVAYTPSTPGDWPIVPATVKQGLDYLADLIFIDSFVTQQLIYVALNGSNSLGNGSFEDPYQTISHALTTITDASPTKRYIIQITSGTYPNDISLKANVFLNGYVDQVCRISGNIDMNDASWGVSGDNRGGLSNLSTSTGTVIFNFQTQSAANASLYFQNVLFEQSTTFTSFDVNSKAIIHSCQFLAGLEQNGMILTIDNTKFTNNGAITVAAVPSVDSILNILGGSVDGPISASHYVGQAPIFITLDTFSTGQITLTTHVSSPASSITLSATSAALNVPPILSGPSGSNVVVLQTPSTAISYTPIAPSNWPTDPTNAQEALDELASEIAGVISNTIYVSVTGSDTTGTGSILLPFATIAKAQTLITVATTKTAIYLSSGTYSENIHLKPNVFLIGTAIDQVILSGTLDVVDALWTTGSGFVSGLQNLRRTGITTIDFSAQASVSAQFACFNTVYNAGLTLTAYDSGTQFVFLTVLMLAPVDLNGGFLLLLGVPANFSSSYTCNSQPSIGTAVEFQGAMDGSPVNINYTAGHQSMQISLAPIDNVGQITIDASTGSAGGSISLSAGVGALGMPIAYVNDGALATSLTYLDRGPGLGYTPTTPGDWSPVPTNVQEALDTLGANSGVTNTTISTTWTGIWAVDQTANILAQDIGNQVTLSFVNISAAATTASVIVNTTTPLPVSLRPARNLSLPFFVVDNGIECAATCTITTAGLITISPCAAAMTRLTTGDNFSGIGTSGFNGQAVTYLIV